MKRLVVVLVLGLVAFLVRLLRRAFSDEEPGAPSVAPSAARSGDSAPEAVSASAPPAAVGISPMDTPESSEPIQVRSTDADEAAPGTAAAAEREPTMGAAAEREPTMGAAAVGTELATAESAIPAAADADANADADAAVATDAAAAGVDPAEADPETRVPSAAAPAFSATPEAGSGAAQGNYATPEATVTRISRPAPASDVASAGAAGAAGAGAAGGADGDADAVGAGGAADIADGTAPATAGTDLAETDLALPAGAVRGDGSRECPATHPIKGNAGSMIYHSPGSGSYPATIAEFCFGSADEAEAAGFRAPRRG